MRGNISKLALGTILALAGCGLVQQSTPPVMPSATASATAMPPTLTPIGLTATPVPPAYTATPATTAPTPRATDTAAPAATTPVPPTKTPAPPTATPTPAATRPAPPATATASPLAAPASNAADGAVQTILDYWAAVNQRDFQQAYRYWSGDGAASGQTYDQFARGFADTVQVIVRIGDLGGQEAGALTVTLPVTLTAVANVPNNPPQDQRAQQFRGTYTLQRSGQDWRIGSARITEVTGPVVAAPDVADPIGVLQSYFDALNRRQYARAYTLWNQSGSASQQTFAQFHQAFAATGRIDTRLGKPQVGAAAGSSYAEVTVLMVTTSTDQTTRSFCGSYTLRRANIPPFDLFGWRIENASMAPIADVQLGSAAAERLLSQGCP